jgi:hypothetical protein
MRAGWNDGAGGEGCPDEGARRRGGATERKSTLVTGPGKGGLSLPRMKHGQDPCGHGPCCSRILVRVHDARVTVVQQRRSAAASEPIQPPYGRRQPRRVRRCRRNDARSPIESTRARLVNSPVFRLYGPISTHSTWTFVKTTSDAPRIRRRGSARKGTGPT